jgi:4-alpha-glucanotransferase
MKLRFTIHYRTEWGQQLQVRLQHTSQDGSVHHLQVPMATADGDTWSVETAIVASRRSPIESFTYYYIVTDAEEKVLRQEWTLVKRSYAFDSSKTFVFCDFWRDIPLNSHLYTQAYKVTTCSAGTRNTPILPVGDCLKLPLFRKTILFRVSAPQLADDQALAILGSHPSLGAWNPARYQLMEYAGGQDWMFTLNVDWVGLPIEYKYVVVDRTACQLVSWEEGDNRLVDNELAEGEVRVLYGEPFRLSEKPWRVAGVCIPVFSLRSEHSCGVGDFGDLYRFVDWAVATGMKVIQLLPVSDTVCSHTWSDSYPYNIMSVFALHPQFLDLEQLGELDDPERMTVFRRQQRELNALSYTDYEAVERVKTDYVRTFFEEHGKETMDSDDYKKWCSANQSWLTDYALSDFQSFVQYHLHCQLKRAADYARSQGVIFMGDLPVGVSRQSIETSVHPDFFRLDAQMGTPPDTSSLNGQNWGFPTYEWEPSGDDKKEVSVDSWFQRRLQQQEQYFDAMRMDHILGYFRVWEIPSSQLFGTMGHFEPALPLTPGEIEYYGLSFRKDFLTRPFVNDRIVDRIFGIHADYVRDNYLDRKSYGLYDLKPEVSTQRQVKELFEGRGDENSLWIRDGLYRLVSNVLFIEDPRQTDMYHPRIQAWQEPVFEALSLEERDAYMRLYNHFFYQRHILFWGSTGYKRLSAILRDTRMLICAEDMGMLPACVAPVLDALRILTLEIQQMPKQSGVEFTHLDGNPLRSVATISTHDMAPLRLWWEERPERTQRYYTTMLQKQGRAPEHLPAHLAEEIIARHLYSPSMLCILSLQDWLAMDGELRAKSPREERINVPGDPYNRWQWRMHLTIKQLLVADRFNSKLKTMITRSKRSV